ncbi:hypothetical protein L218DRAFT_1071896 [Marasmius fiardii PR-910]|nr:hypothetical protein L218DRAFT_1071896 [Marasmius fiardii PR-910]
MHAITHFVASILFLILLAFNNHLVLAAPLGELSVRNESLTPSTKMSNSYAGTGGNSGGGNITPNTHHGDGLLAGLSETQVAQAFSGNAGNGGQANSIAGGSSGSGNEGCKSCPHASSPDGTCRSKCTNASVPGSSVVSSNEYSAPAGAAYGGSASEENALIKLFSGNAGNGGSGSSESRQN